MIRCAFRFLGRFARDPSYVVNAIRYVQWAASDKIRRRWPAPDVRVPRKTAFKSLLVVLRASDTVQHCSPASRGLEKYYAHVPSTTCTFFLSAKDVRRNLSRLRRYYGSELGCINEIWRKNVCVVPCCRTLAEHMHRSDLSYVWKVLRSSVAPDLRLCNSSRA